MISPNPAAAPVMRRDLAGEVENLSEAMTGLFAHSFFSIEFACGEDILRSNRQTETH
jgi:hypothetical protein